MRELLRLTTSQAGEAWRTYWQQDHFSWFDPDNVGGLEIVRHARSEWIQRLLKVSNLKSTRSLRALEAGCGTAMFGLSLAALGLNVVAFDYNAQALGYARLFLTRLQQELPNANCKLYQGNLLAISLPDNMFDLTFNQAVLEYFTNERERCHALAEMVRVTKPNGRVAVIVQHTGHPLRAYWERLGWEGYTNQPKVMHWTPARLKRALESAGLDDVRTDGIYPWKVFFWYPRWYKRWRITREAVYLLGRALEMIPLPVFLRQHMSLQIVAVGRKP